MLRFYRSPGLRDDELRKKLALLKDLSAGTVTGLDTELCYYVHCSAGPAPTDDQVEQLKWILKRPFMPQNLREASSFEASTSQLVIEIGPRLNFSTAFSSNAVSICRAVRIESVTRIEVSRRYCVKITKPLSAKVETAIVDVLHDRMTECRYSKPLESFDHGFRPDDWFEVDVMDRGRRALEDVNAKLGLAFDDWDLDYYTELFREKLRRNPTSVECFDLAQSNSEHSRHWFFKGRMVVDGEERQESLIDMIIDTQSTSNPNSVIKFSDNSSAIEGFEAPVLCPKRTDGPSDLVLARKQRHLIFTAETHNFPTGVAPFSGATTGTGGRIRDVQGVGRGGYYIAGTAGYSVGNLNIPGYKLPWEDEPGPNCPYPSNLASPLEIIIEASNGASDYGNKFGEPVISGFARTFGMRDSTTAGSRREWIKPIMFSGGIGMMEANMTDKLTPTPGMQVVKIGGPVYRIGVGGGAASSVQVQGDNESELDFGAVQRGDAEMEQKLNRFIRACLEMGERNPILSIHDQGAGGNGNVLKELVEPAGAIIYAKKFELGDPSISTLELWGAEYQENNAILCKIEDVPLLNEIAARERCPINFVGTVTGDGKIILSERDPEYEDSKSGTSLKRRQPVDLDLDLVLGKMPRKVFKLDRAKIVLKSIQIDSQTIESALERVLRLPSVASKRYLTSKVDRCVTGLVAQQQCVGPLHTPLADVAVVALSQFSNVGIASSIGEQPIKGLVSSAAGARMTVAEALSNLVFAKISALEDVKCSGNWMWAAKLPGEGAALYDACVAMCSIMKDFGIAVDGGKDSLSMAARISKNDIVKAPGTLVVSCYAPCPDITKVVTPDLKAPSIRKEGSLIFVDLSGGKARLGGTALAQVFKQLGDTSPDIEDVAPFKSAFKITQKLIQENKILSGHDISDGGLIVCVLEMSFAGISGFSIDINCKKGSPMEILFAEEAGWVLEVDTENVKVILDEFNRDSQTPIAHCIGKTGNFGMNAEIQIAVNNRTVVNSTVISMMNIWEETSHALELQQTNADCANEEYKQMESRSSPKYHLTFDPDTKLNISKLPSQNISVAVIREEGINGDREMIASLVEAGFDVWDVTMQDLLNEKMTLDKFRGVIFPGGFSYADVLGSAKGWAASLLFNKKLQNQLNNFTSRSDTFSLGVCNGCQLMSLLGWIGSANLGDPDIVLDHNLSGRFECRWTTVKIENTPSIMLNGMAGSLFGVWIAHGEGRFTFRNQKILDALKKQNCMAIKYTDDNGVATEKYPMNPNGSIEGIAGICSTNGRHLAMMPHPERCTKNWQLPWVPADWPHRNSPWQRMFDNAFAWCLKTSK